MKLHALLWTTLATTATFLPAAQAADQSARPAITAGLPALTHAADEVIAGWRAKDIERVLRHFAEDAVAMEPQSPVLKGRSALRRYMVEALRDPHFSLQMVRQQAVVAASGELGYVRGSYTITFTDPTTAGVSTGRGSFVAVMRRSAAGEWQIIEDISTLGP